MIYSPHITLAADKTGLPEQLVEAIIATESSGNAWAARYEPLFFDRYIRPIPQAKLNRPEGCSACTEAQLRAFSFGPMQIMGQVARELGYAGWLTALCDPMTGIEWGCRKLAALRDKYFATWGWPGVVAAYNAGSPQLSGPSGGFVNQVYVDKVRKNIPEDWDGLGGK